MTDREKVIKGLECCLIADCTMHCPYATTPACSEKLMTDALALLKDQEKTKVVFKQYDGWVESECGNCGLYLDKTYSVCPKCGKELDWNDWQGDSNQTPSDHQDMGGSRERTNLSRD